MKFKYFSSLALVMLTLSLAAFARDNHSGNFTVAENVRVGSTTLAPGQYKAQWTGAGDDVKIEILQNGKTVASTEGAIKSLPQPSPYDAVTTKTMGDNTKQVDEIEFDHRSEALVLAGE
jgi:hypothetical protein